MSTVEIETGRFVKRFEFWNPATWSIPALYWDTFSQEQRIHAICRQLGKVIAYADYLGVNVDDIAARLKAIEDGELDEFIIAAIEEWFEENQPAMQAALTAIEEALPIGAFNSEHTVEDAIDVVFDNAEIMSNAANLKDGMTCKTNGYYALNDGGGAFYKIVESATPNNIDIIECPNSSVYAVLVKSEIGKGSQYGCIGTTDIARIDRALDQNNIIRFESAMTTTDTINIASGKKAKLARLTYTGTDYAIETTGAGTEIEFDAIIANNGAGIFVNCIEKQFNTSTVKGRVISSKNVCLYIECDESGCIWSNFDFVRLSSSLGNCIRIICRPGSSASAVSFVGQCNFNVNQMQSANDYAVYAKAFKDYSTLTGVHFGNTAVENCAGGFYIEAEAGGSSCSAKMFEIESCRTYEGGYTLPVIKFAGYCFDNSFTCDTPIPLSWISYDEVTANVLTRSNEIHGGITSPTGGVFAETGYCTNGYIWFDDYFYQSNISTSTDHELFNPESTDTVDWRNPKIVYNQSGQNVTISNISNLIKGNTIIVSQNQANGSTVKLIDNRGVTAFDGTTLVESGRKWYEIGVLQELGHYIKEISPLVNYTP